MKDNDLSNNLNESKKPFSFREWFFGMSFDRKIFWLGLFIAVICAIGWLIYPHFAEVLGIDGCRFKEATGLYCPGCGGTRSARALLSGHIIKSVIYHPFVPYCIFLWILYEGSHLLEMLHVPRIKGMKFRDIYAYIGVYILLINFLLKNFLLFILNKG
jgi:hypothetical protein